MEVLATNFIIAKIEENRFEFEELKKYRKIKEIISPQAKIPKYLKDVIIAWAYDNKFSSTIILEIFRKRVLPEFQDFPYDKWGKYDKLRIQKLKKIIIEYLKDRNS